MFRSSEHCKRYEYVSVELQTPLTNPANNQAQVKSGHRFVLDSSNETHPFDWYNAYIDIDFKLTKMDNTGYGAADNVAIVNGSHSLIDQVKDNYGGLNVLDTVNVNQCVHVRNLTEFSKSYADTVGPSMFFYPDTATGAVSQKYTTLAIPIAAGADVNRIPTDNGSYNHGFTQRKALLSAAATVNTIIPLNRYGFFTGLEDQILPNGKITIDLVFASDDSVIFRANAANPGRLIITRTVLWVPKMVFNSKGEQMYLSKFLRPHTWSYLKERLEQSGDLQSRQGTFKITTNIRKPRHVFVWALNTAKPNNQEQNPLVFNTYNIANNRTFTDVQLELSNGIYYPQERHNPTTEIVKTYRTLLGYRKEFNAHFTSPLISLKDFQSLYGILYFDLTNQEMELKSGSTKIELRYSLNDTPNAAYNLYALVLYEEDISVDVVSGKVTLRV